MEKLLRPEQLIILVSEHPGVPVRDMEALLGWGDEAVEALLSFLAGEDFTDADAANLLWPVVALGELRDPRGIPILIRMLEEAPGIELPVAAAEALAKIGKEAVQPLDHLLSTSTAVRTRILSYAALSLTGTSEAWEILEDALQEDSTLDFVLARAIAERHSPQDQMLVHGTYQKAEPWKRSVFEETILGIVSGKLPWQIPHRNWRLRYRRDPRQGGQIPLAWPAVMILFWEARGELRARVGDSPLSLQQLRREALTRQAEDRCEDCGQLLRSPTGIPLCDEVAEDLIAYQLNGVRRWREDRWEDIYEVLDILDRREMEALQWPEESQEQRTTKAEALDAIYVVRRTLNWMAEQGLDRLSQGERRLQAALGEAQEEKIG